MRASDRNDGCLLPQDTVDYDVVISGKIDVYLDGGEMCTLSQGSMINFVVVDDKVRFDIAPQAAESSRLRISARLLGVARSLIGKAS